MIAHAVIDAVKDVSMHLQTVINRITILMVCNKFSHTMQAFYKERKMRVIKARQTDKILDHVIEIRHENPREGGKKLHIELSETMRKKGIYIGVNKFFDLLKDYDLLVERRKAKTCRTTRQDPSMIPAKNLVKNMGFAG